MSTCVDTDCILKSQCNTAVDSRQFYLWHNIIPTYHLLTDNNSKCIQVSISLFVAKLEVKGGLSYPPEDRWKPLSCTLHSYKCKDPKESPTRVPQVYRNKQNKVTLVTNLLNFKCRCWPHLHRVHFALHLSVWRTCPHIFISELLLRISGIICHF